MCIKLLLNSNSNWNSLDYSYFVKRMGMQRKMEIFRASSPSTYRVLSSLNVVTVGEWFLDGRKESALRGMLQVEER